MKTKHLFLFLFAFWGFELSAQTRISVPLSAKQSPTYVGSDGIVRGFVMSMQEARNLNAVASTLNIVGINNQGVEGLYYYDASDTTTPDDSVTTFVQGTKRFKRAIENEAVFDWWNPKGDDTQDVTNLLNKALNYCVRKGKTSLTFHNKKGNKYKITDLIIIPAGVSVNLNGAVIRQAAPDKSVFQLLGNSTLYGGTITANGYSGTDFLANGGVRLQGYNNTVRNCVFTHFTSFGVYGKDCQVASVLDNTFINAIANTGNSSTENSAILFLSNAANPTPILSGGIIIDRNRILTSKANQHIYINGLGGDSKVIITNNYCMSLESNGTVTPTANLITRHNIQVGYSNSANGGNAVIAGNFCGETLRTGVYIPANAAGGSVLAINNICYRNGRSNNGLAGGITIGTGNNGDIVAFNKIIDFQGSETYQGALNIIYSEAETSNQRTKLLALGNEIKNSAAHGVYMMHPRNVSLVQNYVYGSALKDVFITCGSSNSKNVLLKANEFIRANKTSESIYIDSEGTNTNPLYFTENRFIGFDKNAPANESSNVAILTRFNNLPVIVERNYFNNYDFGFVQYSPLPNGERKTNSVVNHNRFENCNYGIVMKGNDLHSTFFAVGNQFENCVASTFGGGYANATKLAISVSPAAKATIEGTGLPTIGSFVQGDRCIFTNPVSSGYVGGVCVNGGTPGTWKNYGAIQP